MSDTIQCDTCTTTFIVAAPTQHSNNKSVSRCATPGCGRRYWSSQPNPKGGAMRHSKVRMGVWPEDAPQAAPRDYGRDPNFP